MKKLAVIAFAAFAIASCGKQDNSSNLTSAVADVLVFSRDLRPVDGALTELTIKNDRSAGSRYTASLRKAFYTRNEQGQVDKTEELATELACKKTRNDEGKLALLVCGRDLRPVDGNLVEIKVELKDGEYTVSLRKAFFDRRNGHSVDETNEIASGLRLN